MKRGTRTFRWRFKRVEMQTDKERLMNSLLSVSEELMKIHSEIVKNSNRIYIQQALDNMMGDPITEINKLWEKKNEQN